MGKLYLNPKGDEGMESPPDCCNCAGGLRGKLTPTEARGHWGGGAALDWQSPRGILLLRSAWSTDFGPLPTLASISHWVGSFSRQT